MYTKEYWDERVLPNCCNEKDFYIKGSYLSWVKTLLQQEIPNLISSKIIEEEGWKARITPWLGVFDKRNHYVTSLKGKKSCNGWNCTSFSPNGICALLNFLANGKVNQIHLTLKIGMENQFCMIDIDWGKDLQPGELKDFLEKLDKIQAAITESYDAFIYRHKVLEKKMEVIQKIVTHKVNRADITISMELIDGCEGLKVNIEGGACPPTVFKEFTFKNIDSDLANKIAREINDICTALAGWRVE